MYVVMCQCTEYWWLDKGKKTMTIDWSLCLGGMLLAIVALLPLILAVANAIDNRKGQGLYDN
jgi:hypothetical protein